MATNKKKSARDIIAVSVPKILKTKIQRQAREEDVSVSILIRRWILQGLEEENDGK